MAMKVPTFQELIKEQRDIATADLDKAILVAGPPGSGKTIVATIRAGILAEKHSIAIIAFNRLLKRLASLLNSQNSNSIQGKTMHSYVGSDYWSITGVFPPVFRPFEYKWNELKPALARFEKVKKPYDYLLIDEGQDLPIEFYEYAQKRVNIALNVFADEDQGLHKVTTLQEIKKVGGFQKIHLLTKNHRNSPEIAKVGQFFHTGILGAPTVLRSQTYQKPELFHYPSIEDVISKIEVTFKNKGGGIGVVVTSNKTGKNVHSELKKKFPNKRVDFYTHELKNEDDINILTDGITIMNKESVKGQEFDTVFVLELENLVPCTDNSMKRMMYMLCARARDVLYLCHGEELSVAALQGLPGPALLERSE